MTMESITSTSINKSDAFSFDTPLWDRFYRKCRTQLKDSRYYRTIRKKKLL